MLFITASHNPPEYNGYKVYWEDEAVVTTIVSGKLSKEIANAYGVRLIETLTGFRYIGTHARDKDVAAAVMALCEVEAYGKEYPGEFLGKTVKDLTSSLSRNYKEIRTNCLKIGVDTALEK